MLPPALSLLTEGTRRERRPRTEIDVSPSPTRSGPARAAATPGPPTGAVTAARPGPLHPTRHTTTAKAPRRPKDLEAPLSPRPKLPLSEHGSSGSHGKRAMPPSDCPPRPDGEDGGLGLQAEEPPRRKDPLRWAVHLLLTVYLLPAICLVLLVSLLAVLADGLARALAW
ncbi:MAG: hypothetical protein JOZ63_19680, partial [Planctomycetaceae bacterium]|nr:hypothetical protein [Planctomycetaceae bacterium]